MSTTTGTAGPRTQRAEDRTGGGGRSRLLAWLLSPVLAVVPWLVTLAGSVVLTRWHLEYQVGRPTHWGPILGGLVVLVVAALLWAALTAWSSAGTIVAGAATMIAGLLLGSIEVMRVVHVAVRGLGVNMGVAYYAFTPHPMLLTGSLLLGVGLGAAGARRLSRRRG